MDKRSENYLKKETLPHESIVEEKSIVIQNDTEKIEDAQATENDAGKTEDAMDYFVRTAETIHRKRVRKLRILKTLGILLAFIAVLSIKSRESQADIQYNIADEIIRFHVLANSDSTEDQALKLKVKNKVVLYMQKLLQDCNSKEEAEKMITNHMEDILAVAKTEIADQGYDYRVTGRLESCYFPVKQYGDLTFPEGEYEAFRILIGNGEGKNWWCVMFPSLCMVNETYSVVPDPSKEKLQHLLSEEEYDAICTEEPVTTESQAPTEEPASTESVSPTEEPNVEYRFWLVDWLDGLF